MEKEVLEVVLKNLARESRIATIINVELAPALPKGENYTSNISRVTLRVVLGNGRLAKRSFILKQIITEGQGGEFMKQFSVAETESKIYSIIHKNMTYLMEEYEDTDETLWCKLIHFDANTSSILLEDLKASGYSTIPRQKGMDLEHAILSLRSLGRYHGMAKVLEERGIISKDDYKPSGLFTDMKIIKCVPYAGIINTAKVIQESWGPDWEVIGKKLMISFEPFAVKHKQAVHTEESDFTVLNHGDCWSNNMLFKYDFQKRPIALKFVDYQIPLHSTPCLDVSYFIYLSIQPAIRRSNYELLLSTYHDSLVRTLDKFGYRGTKPTLHEITEKMKGIEFYGLTVFLMIYPGLIGSSKEAFNLEKILSTDGEEGFDKEVLREPGIIEKMGPDVIHFVERYANDLH